VRAYAQRNFEPTDLPVVEPVPAQLEQVLNFEFGVLPGIRHRKYSVSGQIWIGGAQSSFPGCMHLWPGVESFAIFFLPAGWSQLFAAPMSEITDRIYDAELVSGSSMRRLWNRLGECASFEERVMVVEEFLRALARRVSIRGPIPEIANFLFRQHGAVRISNLADRHSLSLRHFERRFRHETGASPKTFARIARFQAALDAKLANPQTTWLDIAHRFGYYDQMHMIRDFGKLGHTSPTQLITDMGDVRPPALASAA
jgi:AraC-like DNA-binding protein